MRNIDEKFVPEFELLQPGYALYTRIYGIIDKSK